MIKRVEKKIAHCLLFFICFSLSLQHAWASVVMTGTRVIYHEGEKEQSLQLQNDDVMPYLVQLRVDAQGLKGTDGNNAAPFFITPPVFRMEPHSGQSVRLRFMGAPLPKDRESLFYLSFLQIPSVKSTDLDKSKLVLSLRSRMKLFYRPKGLADDPDVRSALLFTRSSVDHRALTIKNTSPYYVTLAGLSVSDSPRTRSVMIAPLDSLSVKFAKEVMVNSQLKFDVVSDYGAINSYSAVVK